MYDLIHALKEAFATGTFPLSHNKSFFFHVFWGTRFLSEAVGMTFARFPQRRPMNFDHGRFTRCRLFSVFCVCMWAFHVPAAEKSHAEDVTPTDVYYLAKSIDDSLVSMYGLTGVFRKKRLSDNLRPRNSYEKLLSVADEFDLLHDNALDQNRVNQARKLDTLATKPRDLLEVLSLIRAHLVERDRFSEHTGSKSLKTPSDVTHMLRRISFHHIEIAKKKGIETNWATPAQVYDATLKHIMPTVREVADQVGVEYGEHPFPKQPLHQITPRNIAKLLQHLYQNISEYYKTKGWYDPLILIEVNECDEISPGDSFDLIKAISAEFKAMSGDRPVSPDTMRLYEEWKASKERIVPGDVYRLLQYGYILSKRALKKSGAKIR